MRIKIIYTNIIFQSLNSSLLFTQNFYLLCVLYVDNFSCIKVNVNKMYEHLYCWHFSGYCEDGGGWVEDQGGGGLMGQISRRGRERCCMDLSAAKIENLKRDAWFEIFSCQTTPFIEAVCYHKIATSLRKHPATINCKTWYLRQHSLFQEWFWTNLLPMYQWNLVKIV